MSARRYLAGGTGVLAFAAFALLAAPGPYWLDSQELGAAGVRLGVPHPTGFSLFCLLARLASLLPFGELAWRVHLLSAACAGLTVGLVVKIASELAGEDHAATVGGVAAGLTLAASTTFLRAATVTEVYAPTAALLALAILLFVRVARGAGRREGLALALVTGVGLVGVHASFRLLLALPVAVLFVWRLRLGARWVLAAPTLLALGAVGTLLYLPLRSASGQVAALDWGHPRSAGALADHLSAERIRLAYSDDILSSVPELVAAHARDFGRLVDADLGTFALLLAAVGLGFLVRLRRGRWGGALLAVVVAGDFVYAVWVNPMGIADRQNGVPLALAVAVLAGVGVSALARRLGRAAPFGAAVLGLIAVVPAALDATSEKRAAAASDTPREWAEAALAAPPRAVALVQNDSTAAGLYWLQHVEGARPDVATLVRQHAHDARRNRDVLAAAGLDAELGAPVLGAAVAAGRPIVWEPGIDAPPAWARLTAGVPLAPVATAGSPPGDAAALAARVAWIFRGAADADPNGRRVHAVALGALARLAIDAGQPAQAVALLEAARAVDPRHVPSYVNLAVLEETRGQLDRAVAILDDALAIDPNHPGALVNAARFRLTRNEDDAARRLATRATRVAPRRADAWAIIGTIDARAGDYAAARRHFEHALRLDPDNHDAKVNIGLLPAL